MEHNHESLQKLMPDLQSRLRRIEGQAKGLQRMLEEQRGCEEVVTQVAALKAAVEQVGVIMVGCLLEDAIRKSIEQGVATDEAIEKAKKLLARL